jgi:hypothetical protein
MGVLTALRMIACFMMRSLAAILDYRFRLSAGSIETPDAAISFRFRPPAGTSAPPSLVFARDNPISPFLSTNFT